MTIEDNQVKLNVIDGKLQLSSIYKLVITGWVLGWGVIMAPMLILVFVGILFSGSIEMNGEMVSGVSAATVVLPMILILPFILVFHAIMFGALIVFGLWLYRKKRPIEVVTLTSQ